MPTEFQNDELTQAQSPAELRRHLLRRGVVAASGGAGEDEVKTVIADEWVKTGAGAIFDIPDGLIDEVIKRLVEQAMDQCRHYKPQSGSAQQFFQF